MRVAMVTPMSPESAIADVMMQAVPALAEHWELEVWCPSEPALRPCPVPLTPYDSADDATYASLAAFDLVIYVLGNSPWHSRILPLAQRLPGLAVVHDAALTDLVRHTALERDEMGALSAYVEATSGTDAAVGLRTARVEGGLDGWLRFCAEHPLDEVALLGSLGAVVHSRWHARKVEGLTFGDVTFAPLPVPSTRLGFEENQARDSATLLESLPGDALLLVTVGAVNANRRVDLLLDAIASDELGDLQVHLWAVGPSEPRASEHLLARARTLGVEDRFAITGRVTDALLQDVLARADMAAALREPVLEGQSASVLTQLLSGTPVIVYDHAHYSELPNDAVLKVRPSAAVSGLRAAITELARDAAGRATRAERGRDYVLTSRSGAAYAAGLLSAGERALAAKPVAHASADIGERLRRLGVHKEPALVDVVTDLTFDLFDLA